MNLAEKLSREVARVAAIKERYLSLRNTPQVDVRPVVAIIDQALERAHVAAGYDDALRQLAAVADLELISQ